MKRQIVFWACFFMIFIMASAQTRKTYTDHVIQAGETLYSLARANGVTVDEIRNANPDLGDIYKAGQTIKLPTVVVTIPQCKDTYLVKKKETLYSISRQFGLTVDELKQANPFIEGDKIKKNTELCIPYSQAEVAGIKEAAKPKPEVIMPKELRVAVMLPYGLGSSVKSKEACTMIDFYEGILLAVQEMKSKGINVNISSYDEADIDRVLAKPELQKMNLFIGPKDAGNIARVTNFCKRNNITLVIPLSSADNIVDEAPNVFQVNSKITTRNDRMFEEFMRRFSTSNIIFTTVDNQSNQGQNVTALKNYLSRKGISYKHVDQSELTEDSTLFVTGRKNVIIPLSSTQQSFETLVRQLNKVSISSDLITVVGWNEWQAFAQQFPVQFSMYHCSFFSSFFCNPTDYESVAFSALFKNRFSREQYATYPRFGTLGYDIGCFFIRHMFEQGNKFTEKAARLSSKAIQNPLSFVRKEMGSGFINNSLMFVEYKSDGKVSVTKL